jgi:hypothetical protein
MSARTDLDTCAGMLARHMPELVPTWERLVELAGGDPLAAQMLTLYNPPAYLTGSSQAVHLAEPALVRNYDYAPELLERVVLGTADPVATNTEPPAGPGPVSAPHSQHRRSTPATTSTDSAPSTRPCTGPRT